MPVLRVCEYLTLVNDNLRLNIPSEQILVEGEVSDFRVAQQKWVSFDLKDQQEQAVLKCFMTLWQLKSPLEDGMKVRVKGFPKVYERFGTFKMNVSEVELAGDGTLKRAYELLKKKLEAEGLFAVSRKRVLPRFVERVGLITSRDAAAHGDFLRILNNRWGGVEILFAHVHVQGREAVGEILGAFTYFNTLPDMERPEVLVLIRGGGGLEDLHAFNDEQVARAVFSSNIPVICGVGHERDECLCDFVADVRASTPSNAAERLVPNRREVLYEMETVTRHLEARLIEMTTRRGDVVTRAAQSMAFALEGSRTRFAHMQQRFFERVDAWLPPMHERVLTFERLLKNMDPKRVLQRGYSIVSANGKTLKDTNALDIGSDVAVQLAHGAFDAEVLRINGKGKQKLV